MVNFALHQAPVVLLDLPCLNLQDPSVQRSQSSCANLASVATDKGAVLDDHSQLC